MTRPRIAVVHDGRAESGYLCEVLGSYGQVSTFSTAQELLANNSLPEMDCIFAKAEEARQILLHQANARAAYPVVSLAAEPTASEAVKAIKLGAVDYLSDHAGEAELLAALDSALRQRRTGVPDRFLHPELALEPMLDGMERELIQAALARAQGVVGGRHGAAALLGVTRTGLLYKMKRLQIYRTEAAEGQLDSGGEDELSEGQDGNFAEGSNSSTTV